MKVVAIQGSAHKGNTHERVERLGEALMALGEVEVEHIALKDMDIEPCRGCFICFERGESECPIDDDMRAIARKLDEADGLVLATPVYAMHISYLLKAFVDRYASTFHRPRHFGKHAVGLAVTAALGLDETLAYLKMAATSWGYEYIGDLRYIDSPRGSALRKLPPFIEQEDRTDEIARKLHHAMLTKPPRKLTRADYMHFYPMREIYGRMEPYSPTDYAYFAERGWLAPETSYFTPHATGSFLKRLVPRAIAWMLGRSMDKGIAGAKASGD